MPVATFTVCKAFTYITVILANTSKDAIKNQDLVST